MKIVPKIFFAACLLFQSLLPAQEVHVDAVLDTSRMRIGEQVKLDLYVSYNAREKDLKIQWPQIGDTLTEKVEVISVTGIDTTLPAESNSTRIFQHQQITISVYDSGYYAIPGFRFILNNDSAKSLYTRPLMLEVHTVPTDTSAKSIKDIKTVLDEPFNWKWYLPYLYWAIGALLLVAAIILLTIYFTRKRKRPVAEPARPKIPPHVVALAALEKIRQEQEWKEGRVKEYYSAISDTVRLYIEDRFGVNALESTSDEIMTAFRSQVVDPESKQKLQQLLFLSDLVKFAKLVPIEAEHQLALQNAFDFVNTTKREEEVSADAVQDLRVFPADNGTPAPRVQPPPPEKPVAATSKNEGRPALAGAPGKRRESTLRLVLIGIGMAVTGALILFIIIRFFMPGTGTGTDFNATLKETSAGINRQCPMMVDRETRLDSTRILPGRTFQYNYTLVRTEAAAVDRQKFIERMEPAIFENVRKNPKLAWQRENKVTMEYVYFDRTGRFLFNIRVTPQDY